jgi:glycosyltransferase involved in cell wall biosynthesis
MRILHISNTVADSGNGIINVLIDLAIEQTILGHQVAIVSKGGGYEPLLRTHGVEHYPLDQTRQPITLIKALRGFKKIVERFKPDIVHAHMMTGLILARAVKPLSSYYLVAHIQNVHQRSSILMGLAERVIPVSASVASSMAKLGIPRQKMRVVPNYVLGSLRLPPTDEIKPALLAGKPIVTVGGLYFRKGIDVLISAFNKIAPKVPEATLFIVGEGPNRTHFEKQASQSPFNSRIQFVGHQRNPIPFMKAAQIFVLASRRESFGLVLIEARAAGCAIVASDVDGIPEALDYGTAGILVPSSNPDALADALLALLEDESKLGKWRDAALMNLSDKTVKRMCQGVMDVYSELVR